LRQDGLLVEVDSRNTIDWALLFRGQYEPHVTMLLRQLVDKGSVAIDVGANVGAHTLTLASGAGKSGRVLAFEPNPITRASLVKNLELNGLSAVSVYDVALGDRSAVLPLRVPRVDTPEYANMGLASLVALDTPHDLVNVQIRTLDQIAAEAQLERVDVVKIDVQGYEYHVLCGMRHVLRRFAPALLFEFERWAWAQADSHIKLLDDLIRQFGYVLWNIEPGGRTRLRRRNGVDDLPAHCELLAMRSDDARAARLPLVG
jgi:FkbM family methyltransferase